MINKKELLILETSTVSTNDFSINTDKDGRYILEGVFGEIGVKNKNNRIYSESEYLPQIEALQSKIRKSKLVGELDHPKQFDISLSDVSHVIEKLEYNKSTKQIMGRIRILNTTKGKEAQALIEGGIPLHISSRAAGTVGADGKVKIKKLFTYDLVADPGFENAELKRVNESYGDFGDNVLIAEIESRLNDEFVNDKYNDIQNKNNDSTMEKAVSIEDFTKYSQYVKEEILMLKNKLEEVTATSVNNDGKGDNEVKYNEVIEYADQISDKVNELISVHDALENRINDSIAHSDHIVDEVLDLREYTKYVAEMADAGIEYTKHVAENADAGIEYTKHVAEKVDESIDYAELIAEKAGRGIDYTESVATRVDEAIEYAKHIAEKADMGIRYTESIAETSDQLIDYINTISEVAGQGIDYTEYVKEQTELIGTRNEKLEESVNELLEGKKSDDGSSKGDVNEKDNFNTIVNNAIESAKKQKAEGENPELHFLRFLDKSKSNEFNALDDENREKVIEVFKNTKYYSQRDVYAIYESVFTPKVEKLDFIANMPEEYRESWNNLNEAQQSPFKAQSKYYPLNTQYQINDFWSTRDLRSVKVDLEKINENKETPVQKNPDRKVTNTYLSYFEDEMKKRFRR